jgi:hypothetical protein
LTVDVGDKEDEVITPIIFNKAALETIGTMQLQILNKRYPNLSLTKMVGDEAEDLIDQAVFFVSGQHHRRPYPVRTGGWHSGSSRA